MCVMASSGGNPRHVDVASGEVSYMHGAGELWRPRRGGVRFVVFARGLMRRVVISSGVLTTTMMMSTRIKASRVDGLHDSLLELLGVRQAVGGY